MSDDYTNDTSTEGTVVVGGTATGNIETDDDFDWFRVELVAGRTYEIDLEGFDSGGGTLDSTVLRGLYDSEGRRITGTQTNSGGRRRRCASHLHGVAEPDLLHRRRAATRTRRAPTRCASPRSSPTMRGPMHSISAASRTSAARALRERRSTAAPTAWRISRSPSLRRRRWAWDFGNRMRMQTCSWRTRRVTCCAAARRTAGTTSGSRRRCWRGRITSGWRRRRQGTTTSSCATGWATRTRPG